MTQSILNKCRSMLRPGVLGAIRLDLVLVFAEVGLELALIITIYILLINMDYMNQNSLSVSTAFRPRALPPPPVTYSIGLYLGHIS